MRVSPHPIRRVRSALLAILFLAVAVPCLGAGQRNVHTPSEFIELADFDLAFRLAVELAVAE